MTTQIFIGTYEDIYDFFACARSHADPYPAARLAAQRARCIAHMHDLAAGDHEPQADAWSDPRTAEEIERDLYDEQWKSTYQSLLP